MDLTIVILFVLTHTWIGVSSSSINKNLDKKSTQKSRPVQDDPTRWLSTTRTHTNRKNVYLISKTGYFLQIPHSGKIRGAPNRNNKYVHLITESVGTSVVRIKGNATNYYLAMDRRGSLYLTKTVNSECLFKERMETTDFHTFSSYAYSGTNTMNLSREWYIAIKRNGKVRQALNTSKRQKASQFMVVPI